jgi:hypothetical protein
MCAPSCCTVAIAWFVQCFGRKPACQVPSGARATRRARMAEATLATFEVSAMPLSSSHLVAFATSGSGIIPCDFEDQRVQRRPFPEYYFFNVEMRLRVQLPNSPWEVGRLKAFPHVKKKHRQPWKFNLGAAIDAVLSEASQRTNGLFREIRLQLLWRIRRKTERRPDRTTQTRQCNADQTEQRRPDRTTQTRQCNADQTEQRRPDRTTQTR